MFKYLSIVAMLLFGSQLLAFQKYKQKPYHFAVMVTNPLSAASKYGVTAELRFGQTAVLISAADYTGVYQGAQFRVECIRYMNTPFRHEFFWYLRGSSGNALFDAAKMSMFGETREFTTGPYDYHAGGGGMGRRWNFNHLFIIANLGAKYTMLPSNMPAEDRDYFKLFYLTGPGSVIDLNFKIGLQF